MELQISPICVDSRLLSVRSTLRLHSCQLTWSSESWSIFSNCSILLRIFDFFKKKISKKERKEKTIILSSCPNFHKNFRIQGKRRQLMQNQKNYSTKRLTSRSVSSCIFDSLSSRSVIVWRILEPCFGAKEAMIPIFNRTIFVIMFQSRKQFHYLFLKIAAHCPHVTYCRFKSVICHLSLKKKKTFKQLPCFILKCAQGVVLNHPA